MGTEKKCRKCGLIKPLNEFSKDSRYVDGTTSRCKACSRAYIREWVKLDPGRSRIKKEKKKPGPEEIHRLMLWSSYRITPEMYASMLESQGGVCAICGRPERYKTKHGTVARLCVDHAHESVKQDPPADGLYRRSRNFKKEVAVRGLLCRDCNTAIGLLEEDDRVLTSARNYLLRHGSLKNSNLTDRSWLDRLP